AQLNANPEDVSRRYAITSTYSDTGYILGEQGDIDSALNYYRKALSIRKALTEADPNDTRARGGLANTYSYIGFLLREKGQLGESLAAYKEALSIRDALSGSDPANSNKRLDVAKAEGNIAQNYEWMAFRPSTSNQQRSELCSRAES